MRPLRHSYTNRTLGDGVTVVKNYQGSGARDRSRREHAVLSAVAGRVPVPAVLEARDGRLTMTFMRGVHGQELLDAGRAGAVLRACGAMLGRIHRIDPGEIRRPPRPGRRRGTSSCTGTTAPTTCCSTRRPRKSPRSWTGSGPTREIPPRTSLVRVDRPDAPSGPGEPARRVLRRLRRADPAVAGSSGDHGRPVPVPARLLPPARPRRQREAQWARRLAVTEAWTE